MSEIGKTRHGYHHQLEVGNRHTDDTRTPTPHPPYNSYQTDDTRAPPPSPPYNSYQRGGEAHYQNQSLAEQTLSQYGNGNVNENECFNFST